MKQFETKHSSPEEVKEEGYIPVHMLKTFNEKGEPVGFAEFEYFGGKPSFYFINNLGNTTVGTTGIKEEGVGNELILKMNEFLDSRKSVGYLANTSDIPDLYTKRGWKQSKVAPDFNYYGELTDEQEKAVLKRINKHFI